MLTHMYIFWKQNQPSLNRDYTKALSQYKLTVLPKYIAKYKNSYNIMINMEFLLTVFQQKK